MIKALKRATRELNSAGVPYAEIDARYLLAFAVGRTASLLSADEGLSLGKAAQARFETAVKLRLLRKPVSQIVGYRAFWNQNFDIDCNVLDPRPETEILVEQAIKNSPKRVLDLGTGSGCILLAILSECPDAVGVGVDCSVAALDIASRNAEKLGLQERTVFLESDWFDRVKGKYDLVVSNPPYVAASEYSLLDPEIRNWEPEIALKAGEFGLDAFRQLAMGAHEFLAEDGEIFLEIGRGQERDVTKIFESEGYVLRRAIKDFDQRFRVLAFQY